MLLKYFRQKTTRKFEFFCKTIWFLNSISKFHEISSKVSFTMITKICNVTDFGKQKHSNQNISSYHLLNNYQNMKNLCQITNDRKFRFFQIILKIRCNVFSMRPSMNKHQIISVSAKNHKFSVCLGRFWDLHSKVYLLFAIATAAVSDVGHSRNLEKPQKPTTKVRSYLVSTRN